MAQQTVSSGNTANRGRSGAAGGAFWVAAAAICSLGLGVLLVLVLAQAISGSERHFEPEQVARQAVVEPAE